MSRTSPTYMGLVGCPKCKGTFVLIRAQSMSGGVAVDHLDLYCHICGEFIMHVDCSPHKPEDKTPETMETASQVKLFDAPL